MALVTLAATDESKEWKSELSSLQPTGHPRLHHGRSQPSLYYLDKDDSCNTYTLWETSWEIRMLTPSGDAAQSRVDRRTTGKRRHSCRAVLVHQRCSGGLRTGKGGIRLSSCPPLIPNLLRKGENNFSPVLEDISLTALLPLPMSRIFSEPLTHSLAPLAMGKGLETGGLGQTSLGGNTPCLQAKHTHQQGWLPSWTMISFHGQVSPEDAFYFFRGVSERKSTNSCQGNLDQSGGEERAFKGL